MEVRLSKTARALLANHESRRALAEALTKPSPASVASAPTVRLGDKTYRIVIGQSQPAAEKKLQ